MNDRSSQSKETSVKALTFATPGATPTFTYHTIPNPVKPHHVLVKVTHASINPLDTRLANSQFLWAVPGEKGIGRDFCGIIGGIGDYVDKDKFQLGDRVCGMYNHVGGKGTIASHLMVNVKGDAITKVPDILTDEEAAAFPLAFASSWQACQHVKFTSSSNSRAVVLGGTTATGMFAIQLLKKWYGVDYVTATCSPGYNELVTSLGVDKTIDYQSVDVAAQLKTDAAENGKFIIIIDCIGGKDVLDAANDGILLPRNDGSAYITFVGDVETDYSSSLGGPMAFAVNPKMIGRWFSKFTGGLNYVVEYVSSTSGWINEVNEIFDSGKVKVVVDQVLNWKDWEKGFEKLKSKKAHGKVVFSIDEF